MLRRLGQSLVKNSSFFQGVYAKTILRHRLFARYPQGITVELTDRCNLKCTYCPKGQDIGGQGGDMDFDLFKKVIDDADKTIKLKGVALTGFGEPLLYPRLTDAIEYVKAVSPDAIVSISSNGTLLTAEKSKALLGSGLDSLTVSINTPSPERYREFSGADCFWRVVDNVKAFIGLMDNRCRLFIQVLDDSNSPEEIDEFKRMWQPYLSKRVQIQVQPLINWGGLVKGTKKDDGKYPCAHLQGSWIVSREGNALACCMVFPNEGGYLVLGNVKDKSFDELYSGSRIKRLRRVNSEGLLYDSVKICSQCDAWMTVPNLWFKNPLCGLVGKRWI